MGNVILTLRGYLGIKPLQQVCIQGNYRIGCQNASDCDDFQFSGFLRMLCLDFGERFFNSSFLNNVNLCFTSSTALAYPVPVLIVLTASFQNRFPKRLCILKVLVSYLHQDGINNLLIVKLQ